MSATELSALVASRDDEATLIETQALGFRAELTQARGRVTALEIEIAKLDARAKALRDEAIEAMVVAGETALMHCGREFMLRESPGRVVLDDERDFRATSNRFVRVEQVEKRSVDKRALNAALRGGETVAGARLERSLSLVLRVSDRDVLAMSATARR